jgi:hypothetical protein
MKVRILIVLFFFGLNQIIAQVKEKAVFFKQPKGFVYIPQQGTKPAFYVMEEPVTTKEFNEYLQTLYNQNNIVDVNTCKLATPNDHYKPTKYLILSNPHLIELYMKYMSEKLSDSSHIFRCFPVSETMWKQMKGPQKLNPLSTNEQRNQYGLIFFNETGEYRTNSKGEFLDLTDNKGYQRGTFRVAFSQISKHKSTKK